MRTIILAAVAATLMATSAFAQPAAKTSTTSSTPATAKKTVAPRTEASKACSAKADAQNVHAKDRKKFMSTCKKGSKTA